MNFSEFFSRPITSGPDDYPIGADELGNIVYSTPMGDTYTVKTQAPMRESVVRGVWDAATENPLGFIGDIASGAIEGIWQGVEAPGNALAGEPVTYGDAAATAMDWALPNAPGMVAGKYDPTQVNIFGTRDEMRNYHHGQSDLTLRGFEDDTPVGYLDYSEYEGKPFIQMIEVEPTQRGKGYATKILQDLQRKYPNEEIEWGSLTPDGAKLYEATEFREIPSDFAPTFQRISELKAKQAPLEKMVSERWGTPEAQKAMDEYYAIENELHDLRWDIEGQSPTKRIINTPIRAFHGSPHDFDQFSLDHIGTGEGAQAYGHGLYFAEAEDVAKGYRDQLSNIGADGYANAHQNAKNLVQRLGGDAEYAADVLRDQISAVGPDGADVPKLQETLQFIESGDFLKPAPGQGHMYEVNINANPADFLDWDAPLSEQPGSVQDAFGWTQPLRSEYDQAMRVVDDDLLAQLRGGPRPSPDAVEAASTRAKEITAQTGIDRGPRGEDALTQLGYRKQWAPGGVSGDRRVMASDALREAGIPGIKYKDAMSRGTDAGTSNYVVFDDALIEIVRKYGWAAAAPLLAGAATQGQEPY